MQLVGVFDTPYGQVKFHMNNDVSARLSTVDEWTIRGVGYQVLLEMEQQAGKWREVASSYRPRRVDGRDIVKSPTYENIRSAMVRGFILYITEEPRLIEVAKAVRLVNKFQKSYRAMESAAIKAAETKVAHVEFMESSEMEEMGKMLRGGILNGLDDLFVKEINFTKGGKR